MVGFANIEDISLTEDQNGGIAIGDKVRSFDFDGRFDCYADGTVVGYAIAEGCHRYKIKPSERVFKGREVELQDDEYIYPPVNGLINAFGDTKTRFVHKFNEQHLIGCECGGNPRIRRDADMDGFGNYLYGQCPKCQKKSTDKFASEECPQTYQEVRDTWNHDFALLK